MQWIRRTGAPRPGASVTHRPYTTRPVPATVMKYRPGARPRNMNSPSSKVTVLATGGGGFWITLPVLPGKVIQNPPPPVARTVTLDDGEFMFRGLAPGRYFITVAGTGLVVYGRWVTLAPGRGAPVLLIHCINCLTPR